MMVPDYPFQSVINFTPEEGVIQVSGTRRLLLQADALGDLRKELINSLGDMIARGVLTRFGYQCGFRDADSVAHLFKGKADWILAGPQMHTFQGLVQGENTHLEFDADDKLVLMRGNWHHSYEAEQHLRAYGKSKVPVCWTLMGYASGYATRVVGHEVMCVETSCAAVDSPCCVYELRPVQEWGKVEREYLTYYKNSSVVKTLERLIWEERERINRRKQLIEAALGIASQRDLRTLSREIIFYARELTQTECAFIVLPDNANLFRVLDAIGDKALVEAVIANQEVLSRIIDYGQVVKITDQVELTAGFQFPNQVQGVLGVPLLMKGKSGGALMVVNKKHERVFVEEGEEVMRILAGQAAVSLENVRLYEKIEQELELTVDKLSNANNLLNKQYSALEQSMQIHSQLTELVLEGKGLVAIANILAGIVAGAVSVFNERNELLASSGDSEEALTLMAGKEDLTRELASRKGNRRDWLAEKMKARGPEARNSVVMPVVAGLRHLGYLVVVEKEKRFNELDMVAIEHAATVLALEMLKGIEVELHFRTNFFDKLLLGKYKSLQALTDSAGQLGFDINSDYQIIALEVDRVEPYEDKEESQYTMKSLMQVVTKAAEEKAARSYVITKDGALVILVRLTKTKKQKYIVDVEEVANHIQKAIKNYRPDAITWIAIGRICKQVGDYPKSYEEARNAIEVIRRLRLKDNIAFYDQLGIFSIIFDIEQGKLYEFIQRVLGRLIEYDNSSRSELLKTLKDYIKNNFSLQQTANAGFISPSTLKYRLKKIQEIGKIDLNDPDTRLQVSLAVKLLREYSNSQP